LTVPTPDGRLTPELIASHLDSRGDDHRAQPGVVCITQSTELGTCYSLAELHNIHEFCAANHLRVYMDGARLANASAYLGSTLADLAEHADIFSFGGTKNGGLGVEALVCMHKRDSADAPFVRKQLVQHTSKMRFLGAQLSALLENDLWLKNASHANAMATRLAAGLADIPGVEVVYPVESDAVFARLWKHHIAILRRNWTFHDWSQGNLVSENPSYENTSIVRWMTAFDTQESDVDAFVADIAKVAAQR
jgi:threonine aldolase